MRGKFISLEGGEGVGKSTQVQALAAALEGRGIVTLVTREPGGSGGAEAIRELLLQGDESRWGAQAEALLFAAARADHVEKTIRPALDEGRWVLSDRFVDSSLAYQGGAGGLGIESVRSINAFGIGETFPDRTLVLLLDEGQDRALERDRDEPDRIGGRPREYHHKVETAFRLIAAEEPARVRLIDASGSPEEVTQRLLDAIADLLP
ncbi:MAG TPA: dTMP kinase [Sphingomicrobium sp.]|nr:dTMP kinase [Sphingomicrobium sp.]